MMEAARNNARTKTANESDLLYKVKGMSLLIIFCIIVYVTNTNLEVNALKYGRTFKTCNIFTFTY